MRTISLVRDYGVWLNLVFLIEVYKMKIDNTNTHSSFWANLFKAPPEKSDLEEVLSSMPPFKNLTSKDYKLLLSIFHNRIYSSNEYIFFQGDPGIGLYIIQEGEVIIERTINENIKLELARFTRSDFFGELALLDEDTRSASAIAVKDTKIAVIFKPDLDEFIEKYPKKGVKIIQGISQIIATRLRNVNQDFVKLYVNSLTYKKETV